MKIGIIGPINQTERISRLITAEFHHMEPIACNYSIYTESPTIVKYQQAHLDALLFAGTTPFTVAKRALTPTIPWEYVQRNSSALLRVLLKAAWLYHYDITKASFDSYTMQTLYEVYGEINLTPKELSLYAADTDLSRSDYLEYVCAFHEEQFRNNNVACCFTALQGVVSYLKAKEIPYIMIEPTEAIIREALTKLQLNYALQLSQQSQIVALCIQIDEQNEYSLFQENEYQAAIDRMKLSKEIYLFAQKIQAAVIEVSPKEYLLFSTRQLLEQETNKLQKIPLLEAVKKNSSGTISLGIGFGQTAKEAKYGAMIGMRKASQTGGNQAFSYNKKKLIGPLATSSQAENTPPKVDEKFLQISDQTGISINTLFHLYGLIEQHGKNTFTASDLAELAGVTLRTMNRIIEKLADHGYCAIVGKKSPSGTGRPRRIIQIQLESKVMKEPLMAKDK
ncbi:MAG: hypothetical protein E6713_01585 [Sporomusaceae bacterium]|nr:hypothetical protein [Sporomusaceae bacterium]